METKDAPKTRGRKPAAAEAQEPLAPNQVVMITQEEIEAKAREIAAAHIAEMAKEQRPETVEDLQNQLAMLKVKTEIEAQKKKLVEVTGNGRKSIHEAIAEVMQKTQGLVAKNGKNTFQNYSYATAADVIAHVRQAVAEAGITIIPQQVTEKETEALKNGTLLKFTAWFTMTGPDGSSIDVPIQTAGHDTLDKAAFKANTGALKYLLINMFLLPTGDDPEANNPAENDTAQKGQNKGRSQTQAQERNNTQPAQPPQPEPQAEPQKPQATQDIMDTVLKYIDGGQYTKEYVETLKPHYQFSKAQTAQIKAALERYRQSQKPVATQETIEEVKALIFDGQPGTAQMTINSYAGWGQETLAMFEALKQEQAETPATGQPEDLAQFNEMPQGPTEETQPEPQEQEPAVKYATNKQKEEIISLLNNEVITRQEKTKMLLNINKLDEARAKQTIAKLKKVIEDRETENKEFVPDTSINEVLIDEPAQDIADKPKADGAVMNKVLMAVSKKKHETAQETINQHAFTDEQLDTIILAYNEAGILARLSKEAQTRCGVILRARAAANTIDEDRPTLPEEKKPVVQELKAAIASMTTAQKTSIVDAEFTQDGTPVDSQARQTDLPEMSKEEYDAVEMYYKKDNIAAALKIIKARTVPTQYQATITALHNQAKAREKNAKDQPQPPIDGQPVAAAENNGLATPRQKQILIQLSNNPVIERAEKAKMLLGIGQGVDPDAANEIIENAKKLILERNGVLPVGIE